MESMASVQQLRLASQEDVSALVPLLLAQLREHGVPARETSVAKQVSAMIAAPDQGLVLLVERDKCVLGVAYVSFAHPLEHDGEVAWLEELYVIPEERSRGVGQKLLSEVIQRAEQRGCVSVDLEIAADHVRAANLYRRNGFRSMERTHWTCPLSAWDWNEQK
jgi:ribosomal protein S18 acetylase RimI-like enzyme